MFITFLFLFFVLYFCFLYCVFCDFDIVLCIVSRFVLSLFYFSASLPTAATGFKPSRSK